MMKYLSMAVIVLILLPAVAHAEGVIGVDRYFSIHPVSFLIAKTSDEQPYVLAFNYFFTIEIFVGLFALWLRWLMRVLRM